MILLIVTMIIFFLIIVFMPKRLTIIEFYSTSLGTIILQMTTDYVLQFKYHLYGYFSRKNVDFEALLVFFIVFPSINIIYLNFFPAQSGIFKKIIYFVGFSAFATAYEWLTVQTGIFYYTGWKLWYSSIVYPVLFIILLLNLTLVRKIISLSK